VEKQEHKQKTENMQFNCTGIQFFSFLEGGERVDMFPVPKRTSFFILLLVEWLNGVLFRFLILSDGPWRQKRLYDGLEVWFNQGVLINLCN